jgi:hypothetical protein
MKITLTLNTFLYTLFPVEKNNLEQLKSYLKQCYTLGIAGIDPNKENYSIPSIKNKNFTGYQTLAYYYTSWAIAMPDQVAQLQLPFDKEFALAKQITATY